MNSNILIAFAAGAVIASGIVYVAVRPEDAVPLPAPVVVRSKAPVPVPVAQVDSPPAAIQSAVAQKVEDAPVVAATPAPVREKPSPLRPPPVRRARPVVIARESEPSPMPAPQPAPVPDPPPIPDPPPGKSKKYALIGAAAILIISGVSYFLIAPNAHRRKILESRDWTHALWNDSDYSDCMGVAACLARKSQAENLRTIQWRKAPYNSPLFDDCMGYPDCTLQKAHRDKLMATTDWPHADKGLLSDCMGYLPCLQEGQPLKSKVPQHKGQPLDPENLPTCCTKSSDPAACRAIKRREQIPDCSSPMDQRLIPNEN